MTEVSERCSQVVVAFSTIPVLLNFISTTNRSMASLQLIKVVLKILVNICKVSVHVYVCWVYCSCELWR